MRVYRLYSDGGEIKYSKYNYLNDIYDCIVRLGTHGFYYSSVPGRGSILKRSHVIQAIVFDIDFKNFSSEINKYRDLIICDLRNEAINSIDETL
jgi:hypothetical protein